MLLNLVSLLTLCLIFCSVFPQLSEQSSLPTMLYQLLLLPTCGPTSTCSRLIWSMWNVYLNQQLQCGLMMVETQTCTVDSGMGYTISHVWIHYLFLNFFSVMALLQIMAAAQQISTKAGLSLPSIQCCHLLTTSKL